MPSKQQIEAARKMGVELPKKKKDKVLDIILREEEED